MVPRTEPAAGLGTPPAYHTLQDEHGGAAPRPPASFCSGTAAALFVLFAIPVALFLTLFTELGYGATLFKALAKSQGASVYAGAGAVLLLLLYVMDASYWTKDAYTEEALGEALELPFRVAVSGNHRFSVWYHEQDAAFKAECERDWGPAMPEPAKEQLRRSECFDVEVAAGRSNRGCLKAVRAALIVAGGCACMLGGLLAFKTFPYMPLMVWVVLLTFYMAAVKSHCYGHLPMTEYLLPLATACLAAGAVWLVTALAWNVHTDHLWNDDTRCDFGGRLRVCVNYTLYPGRDEAAAAAAADALATQNFSLRSFSGICENRSSLNATQVEGEAGFCWEYGGTGRACLPGCEEDALETACPVGEPYCLAAFLLWGAQLMLSLALLVFGTLIAVIGRALSQAGDQGGKLRVVVYIVITMLMVMWVAASIAGASMELSSVLVALAGLGLILTVALVATSVGVDSMKATAKKQPLLKKLADAANSNAAKGLGMLLVWPLLVAFAALSLLNQFARVYLPFAKRISSDRERALWLTAKGSKLMGRLRQWHWASVLRMVVLWGFAHFVLRIGAGTLVVLFLSWLNKRLESAGLVVVTFIFLAVGLSMFLLPPVPGIPVYLTGGILLGKIGEDELGSFGAALCYGIVVTFILKCMAIACQQKLIGERMAGSVKVRSFVGINSMQIRAIRCILQQPGITRDKVAVLVGGPDWPTSVLTGILKLSLAQMLLGSLPIVLPLGLTVVAGACMLKSSGGGVWESLASVFQVFASGAQLFCTFSALAAIERTAHQRRGEIMAPPEGAGEPDHEDVKRADDQSELFALALQIRTRWTRIPVLWRAVLMAAAGTGGVSFMLFFFRASGDSSEGNYCFEKVQVTTDIDAAPLYGDWLKLVRMPLGGAGLLLLAASLLLYKCFRVWAVSQARELHSALDTMVKHRSETKLGPESDRLRQLAEVEDALERVHGLERAEMDSYYDAWLRQQADDSCVMLTQHRSDNSGDDSGSDAGICRTVRQGAPLEGSFHAVPQERGVPRLPLTVAPPSLSSAAAQPPGLVGGWLPPQYHGPPSPRSPRGPVSGPPPPNRSPLGPRPHAHGSLLIRDHVKVPSRRIGDHVVRSDDLGLSSARSNRSNSSLHRGTPPQLRIQNLPSQPPDGQPRGDSTGRGRTHRRIPTVRSSGSEGREGGSPSSSPTSTLHQSAPWGWGPLRTAGDDGAGGELHSIGSLVQDGGSVLSGSLDSHRPGGSLDSHRSRIRRASLEAPAPARPLSERRGPTDAFRLQGARSVSPRSKQRSSDDAPQLGLVSELIER